MNTQPANSALKCWAERLLVALFVLFLWLPALDSCFHFDWTPPPNEKRVLAEFPQFSSGWRGLKNYLAALEAYFNDHFGCRKCLVQWQNKLKWSLFKDIDVRSAVIGSDGWFYYAADQMVEHYRGVRQLTPEDLRDWQTLLERRRDWLAQRGIKYLFVITPDKASVYPDFLPAWMTKVRPETKLDQFVAYMRTHSTVAVLDLREPLRAARQTAPTYLKTDTHWNGFGGFIGYQEVINALARQLPGLLPLPLAAFEQKKTFPPGGDTVIYLGISVTESNAVLFVPKAGLPPLKIHVPPLPSRAPACSDNPLGEGGLMVFRDSFAGGWLPFLGYHFQHVDYLWQYHLDAGLIQKKKPVAVVSEMLERFFNVASPKELLVKDALP